MGDDEFSCFLVALFAWYVGPLACKGSVNLIVQLNKMSVAMPAGRLLETMLRKITKKISDRVLQYW